MVNEFKVVGTSTPKGEKTTKREREWCRMMSRRVRRGREKLGKKEKGEGRDSQAEGRCVRVWCIGVFVYGV